MCLWRGRLSQGWRESLEFTPPIYCSVRKLLVSMWLYTVVLQAATLPYDDNAPGPHAPSPPPARKLF